MEQYIDKFSLVAEIERRIQVCQDYAKCNLTDNARIGNKAQQLELNYILSFIKNLEVKEVDFDKEFDEFNIGMYNPFESGAEIREFARHFFELGLKAQKG